MRLTLLNPTRPKSAEIEIVCLHEVIECPPTAIPREEALCLAVTMGVRLVKVYGADSKQPRLIRIPDPAQKLAGRVREVSSVTTYFIPADAIEALS